MIGMLQITKSRLRMMISVIVLSMFITGLSGFNIFIYKLLPKFSVFGPSVRDTPGNGSFILQQYSMLFPYFFI